MWGPGNAFSSADLLRSPATYVVALSSVSFASLERCHNALSQLDVNSVLHLRKLLLAISAVVYLSGSGLQQQIPMCFFVFFSYTNGNK